MNIEELKSHYSHRIKENQSTFIRLKKTIYSLGTARLFIIIVTFLLLYFHSKNHNEYFLIGSLSCFILFIWMILKSNKLSKKKEYVKTAIKSDENELKAFNYDFSAYDGATERISNQHFFSLDLDIFGNRSFFQSLNRTCTSVGKEILVQWMEKPLIEKESILLRQEAIKEIADQSLQAHHFEVTGLINPSKASDLNDLRSFANQTTLFSKKKMWSFLSYFIPAIWLIGLIFFVLGHFNFSCFVLFYVLSFLISSSRFKSVNVVQNQIGTKIKILQTYADLIRMIEHWELKSYMLIELKTVFKKEKFSVSREIKKLAQLSGELEQRANMLVYTILNPLLLWDIRKSIAIEKWRETHGQSLTSWIQTLGTFDAHCSLGKYAFNHPDYIYPEITDNYFEMEGRALGHPLMNRDVCVRNDIRIANAPFFMIITGANMAGKSTYLRTVGLNFLSACIGAPVWADSLKIYPVQLFTSLRTSDSLTDNESYFFAELKRLKAIIDKLNCGEKLFVVLDEILKGTNSVDKQKGSLALIQQFISLKSCGIIATHDLSLGQLEEQFPDNVKNYHFDADITNNELTFSYQLRTGIAHNMNACFLMNKMGITV